MRLCLYMHVCIYGHMHSQCVRVAPSVCACVSVGAKLLEPSSIIYVLRIFPALKKLMYLSMAVGSDGSGKTLWSRKRPSTEECSILHKRDLWNVTFGGYYRVYRGLYHYCTNMCTILFFGGSLLCL